MILSVFLYARLRARGVSYGRVVEMLIGYQTAHLADVSFCFYGSSTYVY